MGCKNPKSGSHWPSTWLRLVTEIIAFIMLAQNLPLIWPSAVNLYLEGYMDGCMKNGKHMMMYNDNISMY